MAALCFSILLSVGLCGSANRDFSPSRIVISRVPDAYIGEHEGDVDSQEFVDLLTEEKEKDAND